jgi:BTB/POZ domain
LSAKLIVRADRTGIAMLHTAQDTDTRIYGFIVTVARWAFLEKNMNDSVLRLNVGGVLYTTTRGTLIAAGGALAAIAQTELAHTTDEAGCLFLDRNGQLFQHVLECVRNNQLTLITGFKQLDALLREAEFFCLAGLISECNTAIAERDGHLKPDLCSGVPLLRCFKHIITERSFMDGDISAELSDGLQAFARINEDDQEAMFYGLELNLQSSIALCLLKRVMGTSMHLSVIQE